jgi:hypothetical protein
MAVESQVQLTSSTADDGGEKGLAPTGPEALSAATRAEIEAAVRAVCVRCATKACTWVGVLSVVGLLATLIALNESGCCCIYDC